MGPLAFSDRRLVRQPGLVARRHYRHRDGPDTDPCPTAKAAADRIIGTLRRGASTTWLWSTSGISAARWRVYTRHHNRLRPRPPLGQAAFSNSLGAKAAPEAAGWAGQRLACRRLRRRVHGDRAVVALARRPRCACASVLTRSQDVPLPPARLHEGVGARHHPLLDAGELTLRGGERSLVARLTSDPRLHQGARSSPDRRQGGTRRTRGCGLNGPHHIA